MIEETEARCLWELVHKLDVPGDILEFGSYMGTSACVLSLALRERNDGRRLHCFDSWEGLLERREGKDSDIIDAGHLSLGGSVDLFEKTVRERGALEVVSSTLSLPHGLGEPVGTGGLGTLRVVG